MDTRIRRLANRIGPRHDDFDMHSEVGGML